MLKVITRVLPYVLVLIVLVGFWWWFFPTHWILPKTPRVRGTSDADAPFHPDPSRPAWLTHPPQAHHPTPLNR